MKSSESLSALYIIITLQGARVHQKRIVILFDDEHYFALSFGATIYAPLGEN